MRRLISRSCAFLALLGAAQAMAEGPSPLAPAASAQPAPSASSARAVTLRDVLRLLKQKSPRVAAERESINVAAAESIAADAHPNPTLSYGVILGIRDPSYVNGTQHQVGIAQPILIAGQRGARKAVAERGIQAARAQTRVELAALAKEARALFIELQATQAREAALQAAQLELGQAKGIVEGRAQSGMMSQYDLLRLDVELNALNARLAEAHTLRLDTAGKLASLLGLPGFQPLAAGDLSEPRLPTALAPERIPEVVAAQKQEAVAVSQIELAKRERWPTPVVGAGAQFTTDGYTLAGTLGIAMDLPIFDRGRGAIARASAQAAQDHQLRLAASAEADSELRRAAATFASRRAALSVYEREVSARVPRLVEMGQDAYRNGRGSILDLIDAQRTAIESRLTQIDYREAMALAGVDLLASAGLVDDEAY
jgi:cobalt-zinc-cadmium efflux system outer membrane protein